MLNININLLNEISGSLLGLTHILEGDTVFFQKFFPPKASELSDRVQRGHTPFSIQRVTLFLIAYKACYIDSLLINGCSSP